MAMRSRFNKKILFIEGQRELTEPIMDFIYAPYVIAEDGNQIRTDDCGTAADILRNFGHLIQHLELRPFSGWSEGEVDKLFKLIERHCSESVKRIISFYNKNALAV